MKPTAAHLEALDEKAMSTKKPPGQPIGDELFELVQASQGYSYISDCMDDWSRMRVINVAKASLAHTQETAKILRRFIKKHSKKP